jgi:hypothetical protein
VAVKRDGCSNTITKKLLVKTVSGLEENPEDQALRVFPNPNRGIVRISNLLWNRQEIILRFYDSRGRALGGQHLLYDGHLTEVDLNRMAGYELPEGVYWLSLQSGERNFFRKLIIHR